MVDRVAKLGKRNILLIRGVFWADKIINKCKRKIWIIIGSIALVLAILVGTCAIYLADYYRADMDAIETFAPADAEYKKYKKFFRGR